MRKHIKQLAFLLSATCFTGFVNAGSFDDAFKNATTSGQFRFAYISIAPDVDGATTKTGAAIGGEIKFETAKWNRLQLAIAPYFVEKIDNFSGNAAKSELNGDFFDSNSESFTYLGEAYLNYDFANGSARIGRQKLDNPFINTDDIRMFSNTFNAAWLNIKINKSLSLEAGQVNTWAGFDSSGSQEIFKNASGDGVAAVGVNYVQSDALSAQAWYYNFDKSYSLFYTDVAYTNGAYEVCAQYANYYETNASNVDGSVLGASIAYTTGPFTLAAAINSGSNADGKSVDIGLVGLGDGNYYASMDESGIDGLNDAKAQVIFIKYDVSDKFTAMLAVGHFEDNGKTIDIDETNLILGYSVKDNLNIEFTHAMVDNKSDATDT